MAMKERSFGTTIKNLLLALLNATLILVALCLALAYGAASTFERAMDNLGGRIVSIRPVSGELKNLTGELKALRGDLASIREQGRESSAEALEKARAKLDEVDRRLAAFGENVEALAQKPDEIIDTALDKVSTRIGSGLSALAPCVARPGIGMSEGIPPTRPADG
ncbi:hypothetical protein GR183_00280 [Stappia sp. GBMRC 2046]|uniref:Uncharacterized protein n=1 Tax=Stappia sediminis TaxID=2692190 RepID=A0A7X3LQN8_9HYPH|nr:hypothetical protein [Stappia sediminis]MXN63325.1 hypothetical protein [Stappia sediminis]